VTNGLTILRSLKSVPLTVWAYQKEAAAATGFNGIQAWLGLWPGNRSEPNCHTYVDDGFGLGQLVHQRIPAFQNAYGMPFPYNRDPFGH
jgi:hypothetical protein